MDAVMVDNSRPSTSLIWKQINIPRRIYTSENILKDVIEKKFSIEEAIYKRLRTSKKDGIVAETYAAFQQAMNDFLGDAKRRKPLSYTFHSVFFNDKLNEKQVASAIEVFDKEVLYQFELWQAMATTRAYRIKKMIETGPR